jgi:hypothetical protein
MEFVIEGAKYTTWQHLCQFRQFSISTNIQSASKKTKRYTPFRSPEHFHGFELFTLRCTEWLCGGGVGQSLMVHVIEPCSFLVSYSMYMEGVEQTFDSRLNQRMGIRVSSVCL